MSQANVRTTTGTAVWYTDKCGISTTTAPVSYQVYATGLGDSPAVGNIYSNPSTVDPEGYREIYVGVGNYLTLTGSGFTAVELGTRSSAQASVFPGTPSIGPVPGSVITTQADAGLETQSGDLLIIN